MSDNKKVLASIIISSIIVISTIVFSLGYFPSLISEKESQITGMTLQVADYESQQTNITQTIQEKDLQIATLTNTVTTIIDQKNSVESQISSLQTQKTNLETQISNLNTQIQTLQTPTPTPTPDVNIEDLQDQITTLETTLTDLNSQIQTLQDQQTNYTTQIDTLNTLITDLQTQNQEKDLQITNLQGNITFLLAENINLHVDLDILQNTHENYVESYQTLQDEVNQRINHPDPTIFVTPQDPEVTSLVQDLTGGGWSDTSDYHEFWTDIKTLYDWVDTNIDGRYDGLTPRLPDDPSLETDYGTDMWQFPEETLELKKGDCEDQAILLCSMIRQYSNQQPNIDCIWIIGHVGVQITVSGNNLVILDPALNYFTDDGYANLVSKDVTQEINNWVTYCESQGVSNPEVYRVFSDSRDNIFGSTSEYITWMQS